MENKRVIHIVDDDDLFCEVLKRSIISQYPDVVVETFQDGPSFLGELFRAPAAKTPNLVFLDIDMPYLTGFEVLQRVRNSSQSRVLPVVMITRHAEPGNIEHAYQEGANMLVPKPNSYDEVKKIAQNLTRFWLNTSQMPN